MGKFIAFLFAVRTAAHVLHLQTKSYAQHMALDGFYTDLIPLADALAEAYQGLHGVIKSFPVQGVLAVDPVDLMDEVLERIEGDRYDICEESETALQNIIDEIVALTASTKYKLVNLH